MKRKLSTVLFGLLILGLTVGMNFAKQASATVPGINQLVSQSTAGTTADAASKMTKHSVSGDGRYVVFESAATNLVSGDTNAKYDVFIRDTQLNTTSLVDVSNAGIQSDIGANGASISYSGRYVVFWSGHIVGSETNALYVRDMKTGISTIASKNSAGVLGNAWSADVSSDGRYVVFVTADPILTAKPTNSSNYHAQIMIKDMKTGALQLLSGHGTNLADGDQMYPSIDCDGHVVSFTSSAWLSSDTPSSWNYVNNVFNVYVATVDWNTNDLKNVGIAQSTWDHSASQVSCNGNAISFADGSRNVYVYNRPEATATKVSLNTAGNSSNQSTSSFILNSISGDGRFVVFTSKGTNMDTAYPTTYAGSDYDVYVRDTKNGTTQLVTPTALGNLSGLVPGEVITANDTISISPDGSTVAYVYKTPDATNTNGELISGIHTGQRDVYISKTGF